MSFRARLLAVALIVTGTAAIPDALQRGAAAPGTPQNVAVERFRQWLDAAAARAIADGADARRRASTADDVRRRAADTRRQVLDAMGGLPDRRTALDARIAGTLDRSGYRIERLVFESLPGFFVTANVYVPTRGNGPFPAVLGTAGHSDVGKAAPLYQYVWANLARRGILVLAYDPPGQGERLEYFDPATGKSRIGIGTREHNQSGQQCLLTGTSIARYFAWDGIRALDYLLTRGDVDPARVGVAGNSGGGTQAAWLGVLEPRLSAIDSSCYITSSLSLWHGPGPQDMEQTLPGFLARGLDFVDLIAAAVPRPYLVSSAVRDFFPIEGARGTVAEARRAYDALGAADRLSHVQTDAEHGWSQPLREAAYRWFGRWWLDASPASQAGEGTQEAEPAEALRVTSTGQVCTSFQARTTFDLNSELALTLARTRPQVTTARLRSLLHVSDAPPTFEVVRRKAVASASGLQREQLELEIEPHLLLPALLVHPRGGRPRGSVVVAGGLETPDVKDPGTRWAKQGYLTLVLNVRGAGALAPRHGDSGYRADYQLAARAWLLGTSVVSWQTRDLLAGLAFLERELPGSAAERVIHVSGITAPAGVFAAALHRVNAVQVDDGFMSYLDLARTRYYKADARVFVPGVLEVTDLPEVMALAAPAVVHLVRPVHADGSPVRDASDLREAMGGIVPSNVNFEAAGGGGASEAGAR